MSSEYPELLETMKYLDTHGFDDDKHIIYYTFLKPETDSLDDRLTSTSRFGMHTSLSRTYSGICSIEQFYDEAKELASRNEPFKTEIIGVDFFDAKRQTPVLLLRPQKIREMHKKMMSRLLMAGSPYHGTYMYEGCARTTKTESGLKLIENDHNPHIALPKNFDIDLAREFIGREVSFDAIHSAIRAYGTWSEISSFPMLKEK